MLLGELPGVVSVRGCKNLAIAIWSGQATGPSAELVVQALDRPELRGTRQSFVHVIHDQLPLPDSAARDVFMRTMKGRAKDLACVAIVVLGSGFWASAMRNAVIGMRVFAPRGFEFRVFGSCDEVIAWLPDVHAKETGVVIAPADLSRWLQSEPVP
jgi:hypothetical protein